MPKIIRISERKKKKKRVKKKSAKISEWTKKKVWGGFFRSLLPSISLKYCLLEEKRIKNTETMSYTLEDENFSNCKEKMRQEKKYEF